MARKPVYKTPLGRRLADIREEFGLDREELAARFVSVSAAAIANYERGDNVPDANVLAAYHREFDVNLEWLITGEGEMFGKIGDTGEKRRIEFPPTDTSTLGIDNPTLVLRRRIYRHVREAFVTSEKFVQEDAMAMVAMDLFAALTHQVKDLDDEEEVQLALAQLIYNLRKEISRTSANPGTTKRSAS
ncbi:helix-turn-helix transcriptional regulator [Rhizobium sp. YJ-22]|uniref:helix-turn-helix domain-containing protein n=1 Tax=Rhizobium sp. YJ-22 TaxID=3037556 RepID=UPI002412AB5A|nr:helix-turn-helix transcriptional regulator [Rhizobium sp. YJ-22]MDG3576014.1 helix-turn-helix transcriptional regulator [Rhizobium sp. YJ-22]